MLLNQKITSKYSHLSIPQVPTYDHVKCFAQSLNYQVNHKDNFIKFNSQQDLNNSQFKEIVYLCTPNNPSGDEITIENIRNLLDHCSENLFILDLTYGFYSKYPLDQYLKLTEKFTNLVCVFSLSKAYPLAGTRMGIVITNNSDLKSYFGSVYNKKTVNSASRYLALQCLNNNSYYKTQQLEIWHNRENIANFINQLAGQMRLDLTTVDPQTHGGNFITINGNSNDLLSIKNFLESKKVLTRYKENWNFIRITSCNNELFSEYFSTIDMRELANEKRSKFENTVSLDN